MVLDVNAVISAVISRARLSSPGVLAWVLGASRLVADPTSIEAVSRDPDDDYLIALAKEHGAALVSGDADLLSLRESSPVPILTPRQYLDLT